jgi:hypothetical protein
MGRYGEIPSTKSQIPNKSKIPNTNDQNREIQLGENSQRQAPRVLNFGPLNLVLVWNLVLGILKASPPPPDRC